MQTRCARCDAGIELAAGTSVVGAMCESCRRHRALLQAQKLGSSREERARRAKEYAAQHNVDLASAYLILLGIKNPEPAHRYIQEEVIEWKYVPTPANDESRRGGIASRVVVAGAAGVVLLCVILSVLALTRGSGTPKVQIASPSPPPAPLARAQVEEVKFRTNRSGALTQVSGLNPLRVLDAFCKHPSNRSRFTFQALVPRDVPKPSERIGVLVDRARGIRVAVLLSQEARTQEWQIGNGRSPIHFLDKPPPTR